jgi:hypothetical protein
MISKTLEYATTPLMDFKKIEFWKKDGDEPLGS